jgi:membrane protease YdiL (CAAX protease family)
MKRLLFVILKSVCFFAAWLILVLLVTLPPYQNIVFIKNNPAVFRFILELGPCLAVIIPTILFIKIIDKNKIVIGTYKNVGKDIIIGLVTGIIWICLPVGILYFMGILHFEKYEKVTYSALWIISAIINIIMQEYLVRGYLFSLIKTNYNTIAASIVTTIIFVLMHGITDPISMLNVLTMSIFVTLLLVYTGNLIATILAHGIWNIIGSLLGCVALGSDYPVLINSTLAGNILLTGGEHKMEGTIIVFAINCIGIIIVWLMIYKRTHNRRLGYESQ